MKKILLLTVLLATIALAQNFTFEGIPNPATVGQKYDITITATENTGNVKLYLVVGSDAKEFVIPTDTTFDGTSEVTFPLEFTYAGNGVKLRCVDPIDGDIGESDAFDINAGASSKWLIVAPGQTYAPGTPTGKTGTGSVTAGDSADYNVYVVDKWYNDKGGSDIPELETTDLFGHVPETANVGVNKIELRTAGSRTVTVKGGSYTQDVCNVIVNAGAVTQLQILAPDQVNLPGDDSTTANGPKKKAYPGTTGTPGKASVGSPYIVKIWAVDKCWNVVTSYGPYEVNVFESGNNTDLTSTTDDTIKSGKNDNVNVKFTTDSPTNIYAKDSNGKNTSYNTSVEVLAGIDSLTATLNPAIVPKDVHSTLHIEAYESAKPVALDYAYVELAEGPKESFHIEDSTKIVDGKWELTIVNGIAETEVWASAETTYVLKVTAGEQTRNVTLNVKDITGLTIAPNPWKYGAAGHNAINFSYKVEQAGAAEVMLLITDIYGNVVYKNIFTSGTPVQPGQQTISWDIKNGKGNSISSGMYQAVLKITLTNLSTEVLRKNLMVIW